MEQPTEIARLYFNNCQIHEALRVLESLALQPQAVILRLECLLELDQAQAANELATQWIESGLDLGPIHYLKGLSLYLLGESRAEISASFAKAHLLGASQAPLGLAFIQFAEGNIEEAMRLLQTPVAPEDEHARCLKLFQVQLSRLDHEGARQSLEGSRRALILHPSLLRWCWTDLCEIRWLRAQKQFAEARQRCDYLLAFVSERTLPRLYRNLVEAKTHCLAEDPNCHLALPPTQEIPEEIASKPLLSSLYHYLRTNAEKGVTKEQIVSHVWEESYNPCIHDDRIYKAVGRLRKLLPASALHQRGRYYTLHIEG